MVFGRPPPSRQAFFAAAIGALYGLLILPAPGAVLGISVFGVVWFLLSVGLLFLIAISYHVYVFWALLWIAYALIEQFRASTISAIDIILAVAPPIASLVLLMTSGYLKQAADADSG